MQEVTYGEIVEARNQFRQFAMSLPHDTWVHFDAYAKFTFPYGWYAYSYPFKLTDEEAQWVRNMLSPHAKTLFYVWLEKHGPRKLT